MRQIEHQARQFRQAEQHARYLRQTQSTQRTQPQRTEIRQTPSKREVRRTWRMVWMALCSASLLVLIQRLFCPNNLNWVTGLLLMGGAVFIYGVAVSIVEAKHKKDESP